MKDDKVLVIENAELSESQIVALEEKRKKIGEKLEQFRSSLQTLTGTPPTLDEVLQYINIAKERDVKIKIVKTWLEIQGNNIPLNVEAAIDAIYIPVEVTNVIKSWVELNDLKEDNPVEVEKYWSDAKQSFKILKVTEAEKSGIQERNRFYAMPQNSGVVDLIKTMQKLMNFSSKIEARNNALGDARARGSEFLSEDWIHMNPFHQYDWLKPFLYFQEKYELNKLGKKVDTGKESGFYINEQNLVKANILIPGEHFQAFDEK
mgnify:CR=1 FL=1